MQYGGKSVLEELKLQYHHGGIIVKIIFVNVVLFLAGWLLEIIQWAGNLSEGFLTNFIREWFYVPSNLIDFIIKPYTLLTYQFLHGGFFHILMNMLVFYWFGKILTNFISVKKVLPLYLMGGIAGGLFYLLIYNIIPVFSHSNAVLVGASASVMAILAAAAALAPDMEIRLFFAFRVRLKFLALGLILINIFTIQNGNAGGNLAHLGGVAFGFLFIWLLKEKGIDLSTPWNRMFDYVAGLFHRTPKPKVTFRNPNKNTTKESTRSKTQQEKVDAILDKIAQNGYDSLKKAEKDYLFQASKEK